METLLKKIINKITVNPHSELGSYIQLIKCMYYFSSLIFSTPVYLAYDHQLRRYTVRKCWKIQQLICLGLQFLGSFSTFHRIYSALQYLLVHKKSIYAYFDFTKETTLNLTYFCHFYFHWFQTQWIEGLVAVVQTTKLRRFESLKYWQATLYSMTLSLTTVLLTYNFTRVVYGVSLTSLDGFLAAGEIQARIVFWLGDTAITASITSVLANFSRFYSALYHHMICNSFLPTSMLLIYWVGRDFFNGILEHDMAVGEVIMYYSEYKNIISKGNDYCSSYLIYYFEVIIAFYSIHLFESLNSNDWMWKISLYTYCAYTCLNLWLPSKLLIHSKKMKLFLWRDANFMKMDQRQLKIILHDMIPWLPRKGIKAGKYFVVSPESAAAVVATCWSNSMIVLLAK